MGFGSFSALCGQSALPVCSLLGASDALNRVTFTPSAPATGILPVCYARSIEVANTIIFQAASDFAHIVALAMTVIMILHVRSKFTAVGRKEILTFFYLYLGLTTVSLIVDAGVLEARSGGPFPYFVAIQNGLVSALCTCLLVNGFVGFQLYEDGTTLSVWLLRLSSLGMFVISFAISLLTFKSWAGLSPTNTTGLFIVLYVINGICVGVYFVMQFLLVVNTLQDRWPLGDLIFGVFFLVVGQLILYVFARDICEGISHYLDGVFFATVCNLLAVMMVYKYWDSITKEDLEFSVGTKQNNWEVKETLLDPTDDPRSSAYLPSRGSIYDLSGQGARSSIYESSIDYPSSIDNKDYPQSTSTYQRQPQMDHQKQLQAPVMKPSRLSYQERQVSPERSPERERPAASGQSRDREQLRLSYRPEEDSTTQNIVRPRRTDDYYDRKRSSVRPSYA